MIIPHVLFEMIFDEVFGVIVNVILSLNSNSCCRNVHLSDDVWEMISINVEVLSQLSPRY